MGCWNETCMLSHLPIMAGEEVYLFILEKTTRISNGCYPQNTYSPIWMLEGRYDDYGGIVVNDKKSEEAVLACFKGCSRDLEPKDRKLETFDDLNECIRQGMKTVSVFGKEELRTVFIKKSFLDGMLETLDPELCPPVIKTLEDMAMHHELGGDLSPEAISEFSKLLDIWSEFRMQYFAVSGYQFTMLFIKKMGAFYPQEFKNRLRTLYMATSVLDELRMSWHIPSGKGSQNGLTDAMRAFHRLSEEELANLDTDY